MPYYRHLKTDTTWPARASSGEIDVDGLPAYSTRQSAREGLPKDQTVAFVASTDDWGYFDQHFRTRLGNGGYRVPWSGPREHFAHLHLDAPGLVHFFESLERAAVGRWSEMKPGRYAEKYLAAEWLSKAEIDRFVAEVLADKAELLIATSADDIRKIYTSTRCGFTSCMQSKSTADYGWQSYMEQGVADHPAVVYAGPDLAVAYRGTLEKPLQRAVVWPERKTYQRIYGSGPLQALLGRAGYECKGINGARVQKIAHPEGGYLMPYVDGIGTGRVDGLYIVLDEDGDLDCQTTNGNTMNCDPEPEEGQCEHCGGDYPYDDLEDDLCETCRDERWRCQSCHGTFYENDSSYSSPDGDTLCESCYEDQVSCCESCSTDFYHGIFNRQQSASRREHDVSHLCGDCADEVIRKAEAADEDSETETTDEVSNDSPF